MGNELKVERKAMARARKIQQLWKPIAKPGPQEEKKKGKLV